MNFLQTMNNQAMAVGYIVEFAVLCLLVWHGVAWHRRNKAKKETLARERAHVEEVDEVGYEATGTHPAARRMTP